MTHQFRLRFPLDDVRQWADHYSYADDAEVEAIGNVAGQRGSYTLPELLTVARWKTRGRSERWCRMNTDAGVRNATARALATDDERERVEALVQLRGVGLPTASVLLHLARPRLYPIIDFRALWSLGEDDPPTSFGFGYWWDYTLACRALAAEAGVSMRQLDRALWQYSKQHQPSSRASAPHVRRSRRSPATGSTEEREKSAMPVDFPVETYVCLVTAAIEQHTIPYSALPGTRRTWGRDLYRIAPYEQAHGRPPLTALVVHKQDGRPGEGFASAMAQVGFTARPGESAHELWKRAVAEVLDYWKP